MKCSWITRRWRWPLVGLLVWCALASGCHPYYQFQRTLSPLGFAWYGDLLRLRSIYERVTQKLTVDRWERSVKATVAAIEGGAKRQKWTAARKHQRLFQFARDLTSVSLRGREPFARWAVLGIFRPWGKRRADVERFLLRRMARDPHPLIRKRALRVLISLAPSPKGFAKATQIALLDRNYWVRTNLLLSMMPAIFMPSHPLHRMSVGCLMACVSQQTTLPTTSGPGGVGKRSPGALRRRLQLHCLRAMTYTKGRQRALAMTFLRGLVHNPMAHIPYRDVQQTLLRLVKSPPRPLPLRLLEPKEPVRRRLQKSSSRPAQKPGVR